MIQKIRLVVAATDLSPRGQTAVDRALALAAAHGAAVAVVHVADEDLPEPAGHAIRVEAERAAAWQAGEGSAATARPANAPNVAILRGRPHTALGRYLTDHGGDLLVVGRHRADPMWAMFYGATVHRLFAIAPVPTLVARRPGGETTRHILAAIDFSTACVSALRHAATLFPSARLTLCHAFELAKASFLQGSSLERYEREVRDLATAEFEVLERRFDLSSRIHERIVRRGHPTEIVLAEAARLGVDLVALGTHGRTGIGAELLGSVAASVADRASADVLVAKTW